MTPPAPATETSAPRRWPFSGELTRVEAFTDAVFGFAVTLLVVSLEVPKTFSELRHMMREFVPFAITFAVLVWIWHQHARFFHRFRLDDALTHALNGVLLFVVLFYIYPLKFLWSMLFNAFTGGSMEVKLPDGAMAPVITRGDSTALFAVYGLGFAAVFFSFALLYASAWWKREKLALDELARFDVRSAIVEYVGVGSVGLLSVAIAWLGGPRWGMIAGFSYMLIGFVKAFHGARHAKLRSSLARRIALADAVAHRSPLEEKTQMGPPQPPQRKLEDSK